MAIGAHARGESKRNRLSTSAFAVKVHIINRFDQTRPEHFNNCCHQFTIALALKRHSCGGKSGSALAAAGGRDPEQLRESFFLCVPNAKSSHI